MGSQKNLGHIWQENIQRYGSYPALIYEGREYTNVYCDEHSSRLAHVLRKRGIQKGDVVALCMPNCPEALMAMAGSWKIGAAVVLMLPQLQVAEVTHILQDSGARIVLTTPDLLPKMREAARGLATSPQVYTLAASGEGSLHEQLVQAPSHLPEAGLDEDDLAVLLYTSGTTGSPKGVRLSHRNLYANAEATAHSAKILQLRKNRANLGVLPLAHAFGLTMMHVSILIGDTTVLLPQFDPVRVLEAIQTYRITHASMVPTMMYALYHHPAADKYDTSSFFLCISGSAALSRTLAEGFQKKFSCLVLEGYGLSEAGPIVAATDPSKGIRPGSVGVPLPGVQVAVVDEQGNRLPPGEVGELIVSGPNVSQGYHNKSEETERVFRDGWLYTGDLARIDEDGFIYIVDRKKDIIIRGGLNIYPRDVEELLLRHPEVVDAAVVGVPSERMGEEVAAFVVVRPGASVTAEELIAFCQEGLAKYKTPRFLYLVESLPKNDIGKTDKKQLRQWAQERCGQLQL